MHEVGMIGLGHLQVLEKFLRLQPPEHHVFVAGEQNVGDEEAGVEQQDPLVEGAAGGQGQGNPVDQIPLEGGVGVVQQEAGNEGAGGGQEQAEFVHQNLPEGVPVVIHQDAPHDGAASGHQQSEPVEENMASHDEPAPRPQDDRVISPSLVFSPLQFPMSPLESVVYDPPGASASSHPAVHPGVDWANLNVEVHGDDLVVGRDTKVGGGADKQLGGDILVSGDVTQCASEATPAPVCRRSKRERKRPECGTGGHLCAKGKSKKSKR